MNGKKRYGITNVNRSSILLVGLLLLLLLLLIN